MSTILTPPEERYPVPTYVGPHDDSRSPRRRKAAARRAGVLTHNRVARSTRRRPGAWAGARGAVVVAHGQMPEDPLRPPCNGSGTASMTSWFHHHRGDRPGHLQRQHLIVERADTFGLSQLHQLRPGGRSRERGYAYFSIHCRCR